MRNSIGPLAEFLLRRIGALAVALIIVVLGTFLMVHIIPGDPAQRIAGMNAPPEYVDEIRERLGLNDPLHIQFIDYTTGVATFDFGNSFVSGDSVTRLIADRIPKTAQLAGAAFIVVMALSIPLGVIVGALTRDSRHPRGEVVFTGLTGGLASVPEFLLSVFLVFVFAVTLGWLPVAGAQSLSSFVLPVAAIASPAVASLSRIVRVQTLNVLSQDYIRTARSKRLATPLLYLRHALPNLLTAALTIGGLLLTGLLGGSVIVENVFGWPGLGTAIVRAIAARDYPLIQAIMLLLATVVLVINAIIDVILALIDPRSTIRQA